jgi:prepilin-type N-terminal cleavage/methylation domain-containing protein
VTRTRREDGFTVLEILIALAVMTIGLAAIMMVQTTVVKGNRFGQRLERAKLLAEQSMEELRGRNVVPYEGTTQTFAPFEQNGVLYTRQFSVAAVPGQPNLLMVTVDVSYGEEGNEADRRRVQLQMVRTRLELL